MRSLPEFLARASLARFVIAVKAYNADALCRSLESKRTAPVISGRSSRKRGIRRVESRYDKLAAYFLMASAFAVAGTFWLWLSLS